MSKKKIVYPFNLCKMKVNIGTGARYLQKILNISKPKGQFKTDLNSGFSGGTAFKRVLRLRIYKILFPFDIFSSFQSG